MLRVKYASIESCLTLSASYSTRESIASNYGPGFRIIPSSVFELFTLNLHCPTLSAAQNEHWDLLLNIGTLFLAEHKCESSKKLFGMACEFEMNHR